VYIPFWRKNMPHPLLWSAVASVVGLAFAGVIYEERSRRKDARYLPPLGQLIDVGGHRLHLLAKGADGPTVVIEQGAGGPSLAWFGLQAEIAQFARVCLYDRAGYQWSDPVAGPRLIEDRVKDLYALLVKAAVPEPYVLVGHSYGGFLVRLFARDHRDSVAGLVLVDTPEEGVYFRREVLSRYSQIAGMLVAMKFLSRMGLPRLLNRWLADRTSDLPPQVSDRLNAGMVRREYFAAASDDITSLRRASHWLSNPGVLGSLGHLPLVVITHGQPFPGPFAVLENGWREGQERLAALSTNSELLVAEKANHIIHHDDPKIVVDAIRRVVTAVRTGEPLHAITQNQTDPRVVIQSNSTE
jgi:pimeloyl-ACP methyl ester carboxylesterase